MIVKVCGMRDAENIRKVDELGNVDWMGFIFFPPSSRNVECLPSYMPKRCKRVGVFVNEDMNSIANKCNEFGFSIVQLHGHETPEYIKELRTIIGDNIKIIKMIQIASEEDINNTSKYDGIVDYFLFETKCSSYGGSGQKFDWNLLRRYNGTTPFILTGGLAPGDEDCVLAFKHPTFAGIDLNSKFEISPALKNIEALKQFINKVKQ
ncbi:MAG: phosphoribosylanthranilate isomerase [Prevotellaceae bacterium]|nr:phosphoribosylanthranilate isomerase [Candidatus Minthosoma caballi]